MKIRVLLSFAVFFLCVLAAYAQGASKSSLETEKNTVHKNSNTELYFPTGHTWQIHSISWSSSSKYIATASDDDTLKLWSVPERKELKTLSVKLSPFTKCMWSPDEKYICCEERENKKSKVVIFETTTGKKVLSLNSASDPQCYVGNEYIIALSNLQIKMFNSVSGREIKTFCSYSGSPSVSVSHDNKTIAITLYEDTHVWLYDVQSGQQKMVYDLGQKEAKGTGWSADNRYIVVFGGYNWSKIIDTVTGNIKDINLHGRADLASWDSSGKYVAYPSSASTGYYEDVVVIFEAATASRIRKIPITQPYETSDIAAWSPDGKYIATNGGLGEKALHIFEADTGKKIHTFFSNSDNYIEFVEWGPDGKTFISHGPYKRGLDIWNINGNIKLNLSNYAHNAAYSPNGKYIATCNSTDLTIIDADSGKISFRIETVDHVVSIGSIDWSPNNQFIAVLVYIDNKNSEIRIYDIQKKNVKNILKMPPDEYEYMVQVPFRYSPSGKYIAALYSSILIWDADSGQKVQTFPGNVSRCLCWSPDEKFLAAPAFGTGGSWRGIEIYNIQNGEVFRSIYDTGINFLDWSPNGEYIAATTMGLSSPTIIVFDMQMKEIWKNTSLVSPVNCIKWSPDGKTLLTGCQDGCIRLFDAKAGQIVYTIVCADNTEYLTYTPEGYFSGTEWATKNLVYFVKGLDVIELNQMYETFYRPDVIASNLGIIQLEEKAEEPELSLNDVIATGDAPVVQFTGVPAKTAGCDVEVRFTVQDAGGGIGAVYLSLNGKGIQLAEGARKFALEGGAPQSQKSAGRTVQFSHTVSLQNGENVLEAYATNAAGVIESRRAQTRISWQGAAAKPSLHVLAVGVNKYRDRSLWLNYSVPDAQSVLAKFGGQKTSLYQNIFTYELLDGDVTRENLSAKFAELAPRVKSDDVFIFYVAGHGTTKNGDYFFIPSNFRYTDASTVEAQGISKADILQYMTKISAGKTVILLDTCNSGAFLNDSGTRGFEEKTAMERLVRATGQAVLMASADTQSAMEGYEGHGVFTYVLLEALSGKADANRDGYTTLGELAAYIEEQVSELSFQKWGYEQVPMKELRRQDFPLVGK